MAITDISQLDLTKQYTYADYLAWKIDERLELIKGWVMRMASPSRAHQTTVGELSFFMRLHFGNHQCKVYFAPMDVRLFSNEKSAKANKNIYTVIQPDIFVVCGNEKLDAAGCVGAPDLVVEVLSPGNTKKEMKQKYEVYEESGVREYWVVHPIEKYVVLHVLMPTGKYQASKYFTDEDIVTSVIFPDLSIDLSKVFLNNPV